MSRFTREIGVIGARGPKTTASLFLSLTLPPPLPISCLFLPPSLSLAGQSVGIKKAFAKSASSVEVTDAKSKPLSTRSCFYIQSDCTCSIFRYRILVGASHPNQLFLTQVDFSFFCRGILSDLVTVSRMERKVARFYRILWKKTFCCHSNSPSDD